MRRLAGLLRDNEKAVTNLLNALEQGQGLDLISQRLEQKQREKIELEKEIAMESVNFVDLTAPEIRFFLAELRNGDINDVATRRMLITVLIKAVYLYDDKITILFNATEQPTEIAANLIDDIEANGQEFVYEKDWSASARALRRGRFFI